MANYNTLQSPEELRDNVSLLKRMMGETTRINIIPEQGMKQKQLDECQHNSAAFDNYLRSKHTTPEGVDYSLQNIKTAYVFLRDHGLLQYEVAPVVRKNSNITLDNRGRVVRDLMQERRDAQARQEAESKEQPRSLAEELKQTEQRIAVNKGIDRLRDEIATFRGKTHAATFKARAEMTDALDRVINGRKHIYDVSNCEDEIKAIGNKYWD